MSLNTVLKNLIVDYWILWR